MLLGPVLLLLPGRLGRGSFPCLGRFGGLGCGGGFLRRLLPVLL